MNVLNIIETPEHLSVAAIAAGVLEHLDGLAATKLQEGARA